jgi:hypothetical protein
MGLWSGGEMVAVAGSYGGDEVLDASFDGGGGAVVYGPLGGGGGGHMADSVSKEFVSASLALILGARVPVGRPCGLIQIRVV